MKADVQHAHRHSAKTILCAAQPIYGHTIPTVAVGEELARAGHRVVFVGFEDNRGMIEASGLESIILEPVDDFADRISRHLEVIASVKPDATLCDWLIPFHIAASRSDVQCTATILRAEQFVGYEVLNPDLPDKFQWGSVEYVRWFNTVLEQFGIAPVSDWRESMVADIILVPSLPELDVIPNTGAIYSNSRIEYTGPLLRDDAPNLSPGQGRWIEEQSKRGKMIVVVTLGTTAEAREVALYEYVARAIGFLGACAVYVIPHNEVRREVSRNIRGQTDIQIVGDSDLRFLMGKADAAIHHGGHATALICLLSGTPAVTLPSIEVDREDCALRLERLLVSRRLPVESTPRDLAALVEFVVSDDAMLSKTKDLAKRSADFVASHSVDHAARCILEGLAVDCGEFQTSSQAKVV